MSLLTRRSIVISVVALLATICCCGRPRRSGIPNRYGYAVDNSRLEQAIWTSQAYSIACDSGYVGGIFLRYLNFDIVAPGSEQAPWSVYHGEYAPTITAAAVRDTSR